MSLDPAASPRNAIPPTDRVLVSEDDAAVLLSLSKPTMRKFVAMGLIARVEMPVGTRRNLYAVDELRAFASRLARTSDVRPQPVKDAS